MLIENVRISGSYRVLIPAKMRRALGIHKGQTMTLVVEGKTLNMIPLPNIADMEGAFPGISSEGIRDEEDRF
jgi:bifunctional DNA-binding transcriptional regulator/antitoxin component of YhaV-PrlF toxin-antitoxin module